jgi:UDP-N-acetylglucosamine 2-epimerase (non-hydrolysing)
MTLRSNTERPVTISQGTNELVNINSMEEKIDSILAGNWKNGIVPEYWDGKAAQRIVSIISNQIETM